MYEQILLPTDGRPGTKRAMAYALNLADVFDATVHTLYVADAGPTPVTLSEDEHETLRERLEEQGEATTLDVQNRGTELGVDITREIRDGQPHEEIPSYAAEQGIDCIVMGTRGRVGPGVSHLGSTTQRVLTAVDVPVLTVALDGQEDTEDEGDESDAGPGMYERIVIPTDGSDAAERAAESAMTIAERYGADVRTVYVVDTTTYGYEDAPRSIVGLLKEGGRTAVEEVVNEARDRGLTASTAVLRGVPEDSLLQYADGVSADLVAMGTRGRGGDEHLLGSTTGRVVRRSAVPVLTVR